jgi:hypothetical protein
MPSRKPEKKPVKPTRKTEIVAFKVEEDLAEFLNKLPNKSDYIRKAIIAQFGMSCPLCSGSGVVSRGIHEHYKPVIQEHNQHACHQCEKLEIIPLNLDSISSDSERKRFEQFFHGGPLYCAGCFPKVPSCDDCGWHIPHEEAADHMRKVHAIR